ncbi:MAG: vWA domain-containing protein, partial [Steroidobacteraceae bacterium]
VLPRRMRITRIEPVIALVDISGSMSRYSRMFLHFLHALINRPVTHGSRTARLRVAAFVFGTRLTPVTRELAARDPDEALGCVARLVPDWSGGTRIGVCLKNFNRAWARRLPLASATVLLVTDGLERADIELLSEEAARLSRSCRRLIWLNPLLRYESFKPEARGVRALLPNADRFLPVHNLESLQRLALILGQSTHSRRESRPWN